MSGVALGRNADGCVVTRGRSIGMHGGHIFRRRRALTTPTDARCLAV
jgi:hypothetical protein